MQFRGHFERTDLPGIGAGPLVCPPVLPNGHGRPRVQHGSMPPLFRRVLARAPIAAAEQVGSVSSGASASRRFVAALSRIGLASGSRNSIERSWPYRHPRHILGLLQRADDLDRRARQVFKNDDLSALAVPRSALLIERLVRVSGVRQPPDTAHPARRSPRT